MLAPFEKEEKEHPTKGIVSGIERRTGRLIAAALVAGGLFLMLQPFLGFWSIVISGIVFAVMSSTGYGQSHREEADDAGYDVLADIDESEYDEEDFDDMAETKFSLFCGVEISSDSKFCEEQERKEASGCHNRGSH